MKYFGGGTQLDLSHPGCLFAIAYTKSNLGYGAVLILLHLVACVVYLGTIQPVLLLCTLKHEVFVDLLQLKMTPCLILTGRLGGEQHSPMYCS